MFRAIVKLLLLIISLSPSILFAQIIATNNNLESTSSMLDHYQDPATSEITNVNNNIQVDIFNKNKVINPLNLKTKVRDLDQKKERSNMKNIFLNDKKEKMIIYPNPVRDYIKIYSKVITGQIGNVKIFDSNDQCIYDKPHETQPGVLFLQTTKLNIKNKGTYFLHFEDTGKTYTLEFVKIA